MTNFFAEVGRGVSGRAGEIVWPALVMAIAIAGFAMTVMGNKYGDDLIVLCFMAMAFVGWRTRVVRDKSSPPDDERESAVRSRVENWGASIPLMLVIAYLVLQSLAELPWMWVPSHDEDFRSAALLLGTLSIGSSAIAKALLTPAYASDLDAELDTI